MTKTPLETTTTKALRVDSVDGALVAQHWLSAFAPKIRPKLSQFMCDHARSDDGAKIRPFPFQSDMADAFTDPETSQVSVRKSSRIGYSTILQSFVAWRIAYDPARTLIYQPTIDDAEKFSRDDLDPVLQWSVVRKVAQFKPRHSDNQIRAKRYKGGWVQIKGANSPKEFRRVTSDDVFLEECDGYPWASKEEGDPARLAYKRNLTSPRRFSAAGSTPKVKGFSRIDMMFEQGSQEYRYVPCPDCGHMQTLVFGDGTGPGIRWAPKENPTRAWYQCENGCEIDEAEKPWMDENGEWRAHIRSLGTKHGMETAFIDELINSDTTLNVAREKILDKLAESGDAANIGHNSPARVTVDQRDKFIEGATNWILVKAGVAPLIEQAAALRGETIRIDPGEFRGVRNVDLAREALSNMGINIASRDPDAIVREAMTARSAVITQTTSDFPLLFENAIHRTLQAAYAITPDTWSRFAGTGTVTDFRDHSRYLRGSFGALDNVSEAGEFKNKPIPDLAKEKIRATTKGNIINLSRQTTVLV